MICLVKTKQKNSCETINKKKTPKGWVLATPIPYTTPLLFKMHRIHALNFRTSLSFSILALTYFTSNL